MPIIFGILTLVQESVKEPVILTLARCCKHRVFSLDAGTQIPATVLLLPSTTQESRETRPPHDVMTKTCVHKLIGLGHYTPRDDQKSTRYLIQLWSLHCTSQHSHLDLNRDLSRSNLIVLFGEPHQGTEALQSTLN